VSQDRSAPAVAGQVLPVGSLGATRILALQRAAGNRAAARLVATDPAPPLAAQSRVGARAIPAGTLTRARPLARGDLDGYAASKPGARRVLARDLTADIVGALNSAWDTVTLATAMATLGPNDRPPSSVLFNAYRQVSYDKWKVGANPPGESEAKQQNLPWEFFGGSIGRQFGATDPDHPEKGLNYPQHTCAARLSWALNHTGVAATAIKGGKVVHPPGYNATAPLRNDPKVTYAGNPGDGTYYFVGAPQMQAYLKMMWGPPDVDLRKVDIDVTDSATGATTTVPGDASNLLAALQANQIAVFAGPHHVGVLSHSLTTPDYIFYDPGVVPAVAWILPPA
jgi:hypothetical protein